ncbi:X-Pro dipeptidyl-peptidase [Thalassobacillus devorans]|uniref:Xaa-Pro dipeptidyl-peptidase n=1 Tax=Thalassobacillus devorans TaxID=279813 RepID=A0ABQ1PF83_9BACI|nr:Xaa-Pro dipeptidyl-peptidase [Thalassobacillus devorans]NIK29354.1 X-Pro dipeptidyl-peptidase [Thalassobacillus devorans]GGC96002.1 X-Pro dipeptidyl-peptidase [Thalassobacillus devorans]
MIKASAKGWLLSINLFIIALFAVTAPVSAEEQGSAHQLQDGVTEPVFSYEDAIRETVYVESDLDTDRNGEPDRIAVDIIRPSETEDGLEVPVIMDASPYYERLGRGNESEIKDTDGDGVNDQFPLFYDNYFVPRGYAVVLPDMVGTNNSGGCPNTGGPEETESIKAVVEWLNGNAPAYTEDGVEVTADWTTGKVGMIGKSYDGTLANGVASTGVEGLETIVPIGAISSWYDYYRYGGLIYWRNGPSGLANAVVSSERREACAGVREEMAQEADDETGDYNQFWDERNYVPDADNVEASVFLIHGLNDFNVKPKHFMQWWEELSANDVPRKIWLTQTGHVDPFDFRRDEWVNTLHRWFDHWLLDIDNGIMDEPMADIERGKDEWETYETWPADEARETKIRLAPADDESPGTLTTGPVRGNFDQFFINDPSQSESDMAANEFTESENRLMFLSPELEEEVRFSGTPSVEIRSNVDMEDAGLTALIVDYGSDERINHTNRGEGIRTLDVEDCWGESIEGDDACYKQTEIVTHEAPYEIVTRGWMDAKNWKSLSYEEWLKPDKNYHFRFDLHPEDYVFKPGHRIGVVIASSDRRYINAYDESVEFEVSLGQSTVTLPVVGGKQELGF